MHGGGGPAAQDAQAAGGGAPPGDQAELSEAAHTASWRGEEKGRGINRGEKEKGEEKNKFQKVVLPFGVRGCRCGGQKRNRE